MNSINYIESNSNDHQAASEVIRHIRLHDGAWVEEQLYELVLQQIRTVLPTLYSGKVYTAKKLCGKAFWDQLEKRVRLLAGSCLVDMVRKELLSLDPAGKTSANAQLYRLK